MFKAKDIMNTDIVTISPDETVDKAIELMLQYRITGLLVVDDELRPLGIVSDFDLLDMVFDYHAEEQAVSNYMTRDVATVKEDTGWTEVADILRERRIRRLPVTRAGRLVGIGPESLSPILASTAALGQVQPDVARLTGLAPETVIINGGQDHSCEALAVGMTSAGTGLLACGTAWVINAIAQLPAMDKIPTSMDLNYHVVPGRWVVSQFLGGLGACLEWWLNQCGRSPSETRAVGTQQCCAPTRWATFNAALKGTSPGCSGLVYAPQVGMRGVPGSLQHGGFMELRLDHTWADRGRAILEGAASEVRWAL